MSDNVETTDSRQKDVNDEKIIKLKREYSEKTEKLEKLKKSHKKLQDEQDDMLMDLRRTIDKQYEMNRSNDSEVNSLLDDMDNLIRDSKNKFLNKSDEVDFYIKKEKASLEELEEKILRTERKEKDGKTRNFMETEG